ncbi:DUF373 family protein [Vulcanisaeta thermophila]|uniref:DUF373 family protein n=1 Tax=Vulcanisaeta thermophila TaxID=867917 RepID=UPI000853A17B|nr:DUF373 family protein [Vulcanisaeta thermophila]
MGNQVRRILVLCVDRDNDVGERLGIPTPVIGRENILKVATQYILRYPDDSDTNAMFGALQLYDSLISTLGPENVEVALVTGTSAEDVTADMKLMNEVDKVLMNFDADGIIVVSDSPTDEVVVPMLQSRRPVVSVRRIIVKQTKGFEEFAVLARYYVGKLLGEPRYRRYVLGLPGIIIFIYGVFYSIWSYLPPIARTLIVSSISLFLGLVFLVYGFNIHESLLRFMRSYDVTFFISALSIFFLIAYLASSYYVLHQPIPLWGPVNVFDLVGLITAATLSVNSVEVYVKSRVVPLGRVAADILLTSFFILVAGDLVEFMVTGRVGIFELIYVLVIYMVIGFVTLSVIGILRNRYGKVRGKGK